MKVWNNITDNFGGRKTSNEYKMILIDIEKLKYCPNILLL